MFPKPEKRKVKGKKRGRLGTNPKRSVMVRIYMRLVRPAYLAGLAAGQGNRGGVAICERCGKRPVQEVHHLAGKVGEMLYEPTNLAGLCTSCHVWAHDQVAKAREEGWIKSRHRLSASEEGGEEPEQDPRQ